MENNIIFLQRHYKILRIKESSKVLLPILKNNLQLNKNFDELSRRIQDKSLLKIVSIFLYRINRYFNVYKSDISSRVFLSSFMISYFPEIVLSSNTNVEKELFKSANLLINITKKLNTNKFMMQIYLHKFKEIFNNFNALFNLWKFVDKENLIEMLAKRYNSINKTIDFIKNESKFDDKVKTESLEILNTQLIDIYNKAKKIDPQINDNIFKNYDKLINSVKNNMNKAFWNKLSSEIMMQKYDMVIDIIDDIIKTICSFIPDKINIHKEIRQNVDIEIIKQLIDNKVFSINSLYEYSNNLFKWIVYLSAPARKKDFEQMWNNIVFNNYFCKVVPDIFQLLYNMIDLLYNDMSIYNGSYI